MNRTGYLKFLLTVLTLSFILFSVLILNALDRINRSALLLADRLNGAAPPAADSATPDAPDADHADPTIANVQYFDRRSESGGRLIRSVSADTQNLNILINNDAYVSDFYAIAHSTLAARDYGKPEIYRPLLAESWDVSPDHRAYRIRLRRGVLWHDFTDPVTGKKWTKKEVTADDFRFFAEAVKNPDVNCEPLRVYYQDLDSVEIISPYEFVVRWKTACYGSLDATLSLFPLPRHLYHAYDGAFDGRRFNDDHRRNRLLVGCGPYRLLRWDKDVRVVFTRFEDYFGARHGIRPPLKDVAFELIKHPNTRLQALLAGQLDLLELTPEQWIKPDLPETLAAAGLKQAKYQGRVYSYIGYNLRNPLFADRRVRQALTMLVDRQKILRDVYFNLGRIISGPFFPESVYSNPAVRPWPYDVERARKLLADAGWRDTDGDGVLDRDGKRFSFTIMQVAGHSLQQKMLPIIKESMARAGIDLKIQPLEWSVCIQRLTDRNFEACTLGWTMPYDPDPYQVWHSSQADKQGSSNHIGYRNPEMDALIERLRLTFSMPERVKICHRIAEILHEDQPYTFLFTPDSLVAWSGRYRNARLFPLGLQTDLFWTPRMEQRTVPGL